MLAQHLTETAGSYSGKPWTAVRTKHVLKQHFGLNFGSIDRQSTQIKSALSDWVRLKA